MNCPICSMELVKGESKRFENICDHVEDPNNERGRPLRPIYICTDEIKCPLSNGDIVWWDDSGDVYIENWDLYSDLRDNLIDLCEDKMMEADNSFARKLRMQSRVNEKYNKLLQIGNFKWEIRRKHVCDEAGTIIKYRFYIQAFKKDNPDYWVWYSGFWKMLIFCVGQFHKDLKHYKEYHDEWSTKELKDCFKPLQTWQMQDNYRKVFNWYVNTFYKKLKEEVM